MPTIDDENEFLLVSRERCQVVLAPLDVHEWLANRIDRDDGFSLAYYLRRTQDPEKSASVGIQISPKSQSALTSIEDLALEMEKEAANPTRSEFGEIRGFPTVFQVDVRPGKTLLIHDSLAGFFVGPVVIKISSQSPNSAIAKQNLTEFISKLTINGPTFQETGSVATSRI